VSHHGRILFDGDLAALSDTVAAWKTIAVALEDGAPFAITVPAEALTSRLDWQTLALAAGFAAVLFAATRWFWRFGLKNYTGAPA